MDLQNLPRKKHDFCLEDNNLITRNSGKGNSDEEKDTNLSDCEFLLRKYLDSTAAQMDILYTLAAVFDKYENNAST